MSDHIGTRIAYWRKRRGMSQATLAGLAGLSQPFISQVEAGRKGIERRSTLVAIAGALRVTVADLLACPDDPTDPGRDTAGAAIPQIRAAILEIEEGEWLDSAPSREKLDELAQHIAGLRATSDYPGMIQPMAAYLRDSAHYGGIDLTRAACEASVCLRNLGYRDLALRSARIAVAAAQDAENPAWLGAAQFVHTLAMPIEAAATATRVSTRGLAELQAHAADPRVRQMLGQVHLSAAMVHAVAERPDTAANHLEEAGHEAGSLGDPADGRGFSLFCFGPTNLHIWRMAVDVELGEYGRVIQTAQTFTPGPLRMADRHENYWTCYGRALTHSGKTDREALAAFLRAERIAPTRFALNPMVQDAITAMVYRARRRSVPRDLQVLARRVGVHIAA